MNNLKQFCIDEIERIEAAQKEVQKLSQSVAKLDNALKARKRKGEKLTMKTPDVKKLDELMETLRKRDSFMELHGELKAYYRILQKLKENE